jgi:hypothetical protein
MLASVWGGYGNSEVYEKARLTADGAPPPTNAGGVTASGWSACGGMYAGSGIVVVVVVVAPASLRKSFELLYSGKWGGI